MKSCSTCHNTYPTHFAVCPRDGTPLVEVGAWSEGSLVRGKYRILGKIGQGGMGAVYKAIHVAFDETRALKVMSPELLSDQLFVKRFVQEAVITRRLQHPNAVRVEDIDEAEDGRPFIVMEYIEGQSLKNLIQDHGSLPVPRVCAIVKQVAAALDAAHRLGMVHRDIKPDNVVLIETPHGEQAKVLDFGIAKIKESRMGETGGLTLTGTGVVIGTPQYMSPEQAMGKRGDQLDGRSDLYSLGVVMYQMLSGELPFKADTTMEMLLAHLQKPPLPLKELRPKLHIPDSVTALVMTLLEKDPAARPANARVLIEEIERAEQQASPLGETRVVRPTDVVAARVVPPAPHPTAATTVAHAEPPAPSAQPAAPAVRAPEPPPPAPPEPRAAPPARAAEPPRKAPPPVSPRPPAPVAAAPSRGLGAKVLVPAVLVLVLAGAFGYFRFLAPSKSPEPTPVEPSSLSSQPTEGQGSAQPSSHDGTTANLPSESEQAADAGSEQTEKPASARRAEPATRTPPARAPARETRQAATPSEPPPAAPARDTQAAKAALALGNTYLDRGLYDEAIAEYQRGLRADPGNSQLLQRIETARRAKEAEARVLQ
jgi:serine/threonine-protein kinase